MGASQSRPECAAPYNGDWPEDQRSAFTKGQHTSSDRTKAKPIIGAASGIASTDPAKGGTAPVTMMQLMDQAVQMNGDQIALRVETGLAAPDMKAKTCPAALPLDQWKSWTYREYQRDCKNCAKGLIKAGVKRFDGVNIYGFNSPQWVIGELGAMYCGAIAAGIYPSDKPAQVQFKSSHSKSSAAIVEGLKQANVYAGIVNDLPDLKVVVVWNNEPLGDLANGIKRKNGKVVPVMTWEALLKSGEAEDDTELDARTATVEPGSVCAYIYTSGTTGQPKAVMMTHDNIIFESRSCMSVLGQLLGSDGEERIVSYLPLSHVAGMLIDIINPIVLTASMPGYCNSNFARPYDLKLLKIVERINAVKPTLFLGVPRVWEKFAEKLAEVGAALKAAGGLKPKISAWAKKTMLYHAKEMRLGGTGGTKFGHSIASKVLNKVKEKLGLDKMKLALTGAAPMKMETLEYFGSLGIFINEVYGMSECAGACTISTDSAHVWGSCGYPMPGVEVKIFKPSESGELVECPRAANMNRPTEEEQGEICFRGRNTMAGYMANPELGKEHVKTIEKKNAGAVDEYGWLHSGDKGCKDATGFVKITGRYKELIITAGGENIAPVPIEDEVKKTCPAISNIVMVGDKRKFNCALITLKAYGTGEEPGGEKLEKAAQLYGCSTIGEAMRNKEYTDMIKNAIIKVNKNGDVCPSSASQIQKFTILPIDFSVTGGELTATLKTKRSVVSKMNEKAINRMYDGNVPRAQAFVPYCDPLPALGGADVKVDG